METSLDSDAVFFVVFENYGLHEGGCGEGGEDEHEPESEDVYVPHVDIHGYITCV